MYPVLVACLTGSESWSHNSHDLPHSEMHNYPADIANPHFIRVPLLSYCRTQCWDALAEANLVPADVNRLAVCWRAAVPRNPYVSKPDIGLLHINDSRLELYMKGTDKTIPFTLIASLPLVGAEFDALPLVARLGIELLYRKECNGNDSE